MNSSKRTQAMTLVEVVFAMGLLVIFMGAIFATYAVSGNTSTLSREHQAASNAALKQLDAILANPVMDSIPRNGSNDVEALAFHVPMGADNLVPADDSFLLRNTGTKADMAGHVQVIELDVDKVGTDNPDDYDGDGFADFLEIRVTVAWRSAGLTGDAPFSRVDVSARRTR